MILLPKNVLKKGFYSSILNNYLYIFTNRGIHLTSSAQNPKIPGIYDTEYRQGVAKDKDYNYVHPSRPKEKPLKSLPFDGKSTYRENYHSNGPLDNNTAIKAKDNLQTDTKQPFNSKSTYKQEYIPYTIEKGPVYYNRNKEGHMQTPEQIAKPISQYQSNYQLIDLKTI